MKYCRVLFSLIILTGCSIFNNPVDSSSSSFQGYITTNSVNSMNIHTYSIISKTIYATNVLGATKYHVQVASDMDFTLIKYENDSLTKNIITIDYDFEPAKYYIRVRAFKDSWGSWSGSVIFNLVKLDDDSVSILYRVFANVTGGTFNESDSNGNSFLHSISDYKIGKYEVTFDLWYEVYSWGRVNGYNFENRGREGHDGFSSGFPSSDRYEPVTDVSWRDAIVWCNAYSDMEGLEPVYRDSNGLRIMDSRSTNGTECDNAIVYWDNNGYRLPTEGEWQFAARGGQFSKNYIYSGSNNADDVAWYFLNSSKTKNCGSKTPNELDVYDMSGNVYEWCYDWYGEYPVSGNNYSGVLSSSYKVMLGGGYNSSVENTQINRREKYLPTYKNINAGFRVVKK